MYDAVDYTPVGFVNAAAASAPGDSGRELSGWLRQLREQAGLTREELAAAVGTDRRNIYRWEVEGHDPSGSVLLRLLSALGVRVEPAPPAEMRAVNEELLDLRAELREAADVSAARLDELLARVEAQDEAIRLLTIHLSDSSLPPR
jgi:transcriptional regulator with XRE-family HTH domain